MSSRVALITGITGQDGSYLAEFLLGMGYRVHGVVRRSSSPNTDRIDHLRKKFSHNQLVLAHGDITDPISIGQIIRDSAPTEIYNLAAQSHVRYSFEAPVSTAQTSGLAAMTLLESVRIFAPEAKVYQASTSELFGMTEPPQSETSPFYPRSPYAAAKLYAFWAAKNYREAYSLQVSNGILFNHESPRRGLTFVTRKITRAAALIRQGSTERLSLGNLDAIRDWGYAPEYVVAMWKLLQTNSPGVDIVVATGQGHTVRDFLDWTFSEVGLSWEDWVDIDPKYFRPTEVDALIGDVSKLQANLGWKPSTLADELARIMVRHDIQLLEKGNVIDSPDFSKILDES